MVCKIFSSLCFYFLFLSCFILIFFKESKLSAFFFFLHLVFDSGHNLCLPQLVFDLITNKFGGATDELTSSEKLVAR